jgi:hypothetical protein
MQEEMQEYSILHRSWPRETCNEARRKEKEMTATKPEGPGRGQKARGFGQRSAYPSLIRAQRQHGGGAEVYNVLG